MSRVVLITGASGNLGRAVASAFEEQGDSLALLGHSAAPATGAVPGPLRVPTVKCGAMPLPRAAS